MAVMPESLPRPAGVPSNPFAGFAAPPPSFVPVGRFATTHPPPGEFYTPYRPPSAGWKIAGVGLAIMVVCSGVSLLTSLYAADAVEAGIEATGPRGRPPEMDFEQAARATRQAVRDAAQAARFGQVMFYGVVYGFFIFQCGVVKLFLDKQAVFEQHVGQQVSVQNSRIEGAFQMARDSHVAGQVGAMGPNAHAHDISMAQTWTQVAGQVDLPGVAAELPALRKEMRQRAETADQDVAVADVAAAEGAAAKGDGPKTLDHLKKAGAWALEVATTAGLTAAVNALKKALGV